VKLKLFFLSVFILFVKVNNYAQPIDFSKYSAHKIKKMADNALRYNDYYHASDLYTLYLEKKPKKKNVYKGLADAYRFSRNYPKAQINYQKHLEFYTNDIEAKLYLAQMCKMQGEYDSAKIQLEKLLADIGKNKKLNAISERAQIELEGCKMGLNKQDSAHVVAKIFEINDTSINKAYNDFNPIFWEDDFIVFSSFRSDTLVYFNEENYKDLAYTSFYTAEQIKGEWIGKGEWKSGLAADFSNMSNGAFSIDKKRFYFSSCGRNWQGSIYCNLYLSEYKNNKWQKAVKLPYPINSSQHSSTQPSVGIVLKNNRDMVYFVSNNKSGRGGYDIWYFTYDPKKKRFSAPHNAGRKLNTQWDEMSPFIENESGKLYFSSDGYAGYGGFDVFVSYGEKSKWEIPVNIGPFINSEVDELYFVINPFTQSGFFSSNRESSVVLKHKNCCDDLYFFKQENFYSIPFIGKIFLEKPDGSFVIPDTAEIKLFLVEKTTGEIIPIVSKYSDPGGNFKLVLNPGKDYEIKVEVENYFTQTHQLTTKDTPPFDTLKNEFSLKLIPDEEIVLPSILYDFDSYELTALSKKMLDSLLVPILRNNPRLIIEIGSHTDSKGNDMYNLKLSQQRAQSVVNFLQSKGVSKSRLKAKGYGESLPIAPNTKPDGSDNPEGRALNRRTTFKIVGKLQLVEEDD
jgi:OOP family OmpA-OmpF porin